MTYSDWQSKLFAYHNEIRNTPVLSGSTTRRVSKMELLEAALFSVEQVSPVLIDFAVSSRRQRFPLSALSTLTLFSSGGKLVSYRQFCRNALGAHAYCIGGRLESVASSPWQLVLYRRPLLPERAFRRVRRRRHNNAPTWRNFCAAWPATPGCRARGVPRRTPKGLERDLSSTVPSIGDPSSGSDPANTASSNQAIHSGLSEY